MKSVDTRYLYNRNSGLYNLLEFPMEILFYRWWRKLLFRRLKGNRILEVGVGTGKNISYYQDSKHITAIDISEGMLSYAKGESRMKRADLVQADVENLPFEDNSFDSVFATFVFCSVPDPGDGLKEIKRVLRPGGRLFLIEHVLPSKDLPAKLFNILNPLILKRTGVNINRKTGRCVEEAGFNLVKVSNLLFSVFRFFESEPSYV